MATLDATALPPAALAELPALCRCFGVARLDVFGSAVTGRFDPARSDLDFLVTFDPATMAGRRRDYFGLAEALRALFGRGVDLLTEQSLENPFLRRRVTAERVPLFRDAACRTVRRSCSGTPGALRAVQSSFWAA